MKDALVNLKNVFAFGCPRAATLHCYFILRIRKCFNFLCLFIKLYVIIIYIYAKIYNF